ncbi:glycerophosphodiester phosphodiesterase [Paenibacillus sp. Marseille-Q4541]|uniref:glycerophosphodiester phosphodiesterase n=1 Tax=Paenibacillus sp. Marseille-Q4541 TaxID=2831522 RepID=UPI001BA71A58|nr:glycerophosphodiester phosphodiesterase [Paenibacillus sp. Marseille-Q4541]
MKSPLIIAHRGAKGEAPENTIAAFELALEQGCDAFELDIHLSQDGEIMVIHDDTVNRTTNGEGKVKDMTFSELRMLDAGQWFDSSYEGQVIPTLKEVFDLAPDHLIINVEIKGGISEGVEEKLLALLEDYDMFERVVVSSFHFDSLRTLESLNPEVKTGLLYTQNFACPKQLPEAAGVNAYSLHPYFIQLEEGDYDSVQQEGVQIFAWTVNEVVDMQKLLEIGIDGIITDYPGRLKTLVEEKKVVN